MDTTPGNDDALREQGDEGEAKKTQHKIITKLDRVTDLLKTRPEGLNRYEAERYGDHTLNSTVAVIRARYGARLIQRWEKVPTRYCASGVRVLRYWIVSEGA